MSVALSRVATRVPAGIAAKAAVARGFATEKQLLEKMTTTKGISKITSSMKMVATSKLKGDEKRLAEGKGFSVFADNLNSPLKAVEDGLPEASEIEGKTMILAVTSDKGLCGGVNTFIAKAVKQFAATLDNNDKDYNIMIVGDKGRAPIGNFLGEKVLTSINDSWSTPTNFSQVSAIAAQVSAEDFDQCYIFFNEFQSMIAYTPSYRKITALKYAGDQAEGEQPLMEYDVEPEDRTEAMESLNQFALAGAMYSSFLDQATSFQSSQMTAMENATNNANEVVEKLTIQYNRARQARITTELIEIISGASALDG